MKKGKLLLLAMGLVMGTSAARAVPVSPYSVDFNDKIDVTPHDFKVAKGWSHNVDSYISDSYYYGEEEKFIKYLYYDNKGVDGSGCIYVDKQYNTSYYDDSWDTYDMMVTPPVSGAVSLDAMLSTSSSFIEIFVINEDGTRGEKLGRWNNQSQPELNTASYVSIPLTLEQPTRLGIRGNSMYIDNFTADTADIDPRGMSIVSAPSHCDHENKANDGTTGVIYWLQQPESMKVKVCYLVTVKNTGTVALIPGDNKYSISILHKKTNEIVATVGVPYTVQPGEISEPFEVSALVDEKRWTSSSSTAEYFHLINNLDEVTLSRAQSGYKPYKHELVFRGVGEYITKPTTTPLNFGMVSSTVSKSFELFNNGAAPLHVTNATISAPFITDLKETDFVVGPGVKDTITITMPVEAQGMHSGQFALTYVDNDGSDKTYTMEVSGNMIAEGTWMCSFDAAGSTGSSVIYPAGTVAEGSLKGDYSYVNGGYDRYIYGQSDSNNKFYTPLLHAEAGSTMAFDLKPKSTSAKMQVYLATDRYNLTDTIAEFTFADGLSTSAWTTKSITIPEAGDYYIVFASYNMYLDNIAGLSLVEKTFDLFFREINQVDERQSGKEFTSTVYAIPTLPATDADYTVQFFFDGEPNGEFTPVNMPQSATTAKNFKATLTPVVEATRVIPTYWQFNFTDGSIFTTPVKDLKVICESTFCLIKKGSYRGNDYDPPTSEKLYQFGKVNQSNLAVEYEIFNWGQAPLTLNSISVPEGFSYTATDPETGEPVSFPTVLPSKGVINFTVTLIGTEIGIYSGDVAIGYNDPEGNPTEHKLAVGATLLDVTKMYVTFDNGTTTGAIPAGFIREKKSEITLSNLGSYAVPNMAASCTSSNGTLLISPKVHMEAGEQMTFDARCYSSYWSEGGVKVYIAPTREDLHNEDVRTMIADVCGEYEDEAVKLDITNFQTFTATAPAAGDFYVGIEIYGRAYIDEIYGFTIVPVAHDLSVSGFVAPVNATQNAPFSTTLGVRNFGLAEEEAGSYSVVLTIGDKDIVVSDTPAIPTTTDADGTTTGVSSSVIFGKVGEFPISAKIIFDGYELASEQSTITFAEEVLSSEKQVGEFDSWNTVPFFNNYRNVETVALYTPDQLGIAVGENIETITVRGYESAKLTADYVVAYAWVDETTLAKPESSSKFDISNMTVVNNEERVWGNAGSASAPIDIVTIPVNAAYDGKSLMVFFGGYSDTYASAAKTELSKLTGNCWFRQNDGNKGVMTGSWLAKNSPVLHITLTPNPKSVSGTVVDIDNNPVEGATVTLSDTEGAGVEYAGTTDADGNYLINVIQATRNYNIDVVAGDMEDSIADVSFEESQTKNFKVAVTVHIHGEANGAKTSDKARVHFNLDLEPGFNALALPFALDATLAAQLFGDESQLFVLDASVANEGTVTAHFKRADAVEAGKPFLVLATAPDKVTIEGIATSAEPVADETEHVVFAAAYSASDPDGKFALSDDNFADETIEQPAMFSATPEATDKVAAYQAVITAKDGVAMDALNFSLKKVTGIDAITIEFEEGAAYDLRGIRVAKPAAGIYIINGQKVLVK